MLAAVETEDRSVTINLRAARKQRELIDRAAQATGKSRTEFMLDSACRAAEDALLDQRVFFLDDEQYAAFVEALDRPPSTNPKLKALMARKAPWEK